MKGRWVMKRCLVLLTVALCAGLFVVSAAFGASSVWWTNFNDKISSTNLDGTGTGANFTPQAPGVLSGPLGLAIEPATGKIYWPNYFTPYSINVGNLDGSGSGQLDTGTANVVQPEGVALDPADRKIFWANDGDNKISYTNLDDSGVGANLVTTPITPDSPAGVTVDPANGRIYWGNEAPGNGSIGYANLDGSGGGGTLVTSAPVVDPGGIAIDNQTGKIYWANSASNGDSISFANLDGSAGGTLNVPASVTLADPTGVAIDPVAGKLYWANDESPNGIFWADLDNDGGGGELTTPANTANATVFQPNYPFLFEAPLGLSAPAASGATTPGSALSCTQATWAPDLVSEFDYRAPASTSSGWSINGIPIPGATASTIVANVPGSYTCTATATNGAGSTTQRSNAIVVSAPVLPITKPSTPAPTSAQLKADLLAQLVPKGSAAKIASLLKKGYPFSFKALAAGKLVIDWYYVPKGAHVAKAKAKPKPLLVAVGKLTSTKAGSAKLTIRLTSAGKKLLKHAKRISLSAKGTVTVGRTTVTAIKTFTLKR
jgi:DNA-binding beta-propeller fold protein YncE